VSSATRPLLATLAGRTIAMINGSWTAGVCGIGDYTQGLVSELERAHGATITKVDTHSIATLRRIVRSEHPILLHHQYPTIGVGRSISAPFGPVVGRSILTLHEFSRSHPLRRAASVVMQNAADVVVEAQAARRFLRPGIRTVVIPVPSSIPTFHGRVEQRYALAFFGLLAPGKGLEEFLAAARYSSVPAVVIGSCVPTAAAWLSELQHRYRSDDIEFTGMVSSIEVAQLLAASRFAFLPFSDGVSERRTSLLAALANGAVVLSTIGIQTTDALRQVVEATPDMASVKRALGMSEERRIDLQTRGRLYAEERGVEGVGRAHAELYLEVGDLCA
jgi:glycosyltransferase involved in cell wall biosynthesis